MWDTPGMGHEDMGFQGHIPGSVGEFAAISRDHYERTNGHKRYGPTAPARPMGKVGYFFFALISSLVLLALSTIATVAVARWVLPQIRAFYGVFPSSWTTSQAGSEGWARFTGYLIITWALAVVVIVVATVCINLLMRAPMSRGRWILAPPYILLAILRGAAVCAALTLTLLAPAVIENLHPVTPSSGWPLWVLVVAMLLGPVWLGLVTFSWGVIPPRQEQDAIADS